MCAGWRRCGRDGGWRGTRVPDIGHPRRHRAARVGDNCRVHRWCLLGELGAGRLGVGRAPGPLRLRRQTPQLNPVSVGTAKRVGAAKFNSGRPPSNIRPTGLPGKSPATSTCPTASSAPTSPSTPSPSPGRCARPTSSGRGTPTTALPGAPGSAGQSSAPPPPDQLSQQRHTAADPLGIRAYGRPRRSTRRAESRGDQFLAASL